MTVLLPTVIIAWSGMLYELVLAQTLAAVFGGTILQYSITIGVFMASLGAGALAVMARPAAHLWRRLLRVEFVMAIVGAGGPALILALHQIHDLGFVIQVLCYSVIALVGFCSGFELPLLMRLGSQAGLSSGVVLMADYFGMLLAAVLFPLLLLPKLGVFGTSLLASALNFAVVLSLSWRPDAREGLMNRIAFAVMASLNLALLILNRSVEGFFSRMFF